MGFTVGIWVVIRVSGRGSVIEQNCESGWERGRDRGRTVNQVGRGTEMWAKLRIRVGEGTVIGT